MTISSKAEDKPMCSNKSMSGYLSQGSEDKCPRKGLAWVPRSEMPQVCMERQMAQQVRVYLHHGILLSNKRKKLLILATIEQIMTLYKSVTEQYVLPHR